MEAPYVIRLLLIIFVITLISVDNVHSVYLLSLDLENFFFSIIKWKLLEIKHCLMLPNLANFSFRYFEFMPENFEKYFSLFY